MNIRCPKCRKIFEANAQQEYFVNQSIGKNMNLIFIECPFCYVNVPINPADLLLTKSPEVKDDKLICNPIKKLTTLLQSCDFTIDKQELRDWHFNEFEVVMSGIKSKLPAKIDIEGIEQHDEHTYICKCHWSVVRLLFKNND